MNQDTAHHVTTMDDHNSVDIVPSMDNVEEAYETAVRYDEVFPALESQQINESKEAGQLGQWNQRMKTKSSIITRVFRVPVEERRFHDVSNTRFGEQGEQAKICAEIIRDTSADIEISSSKDQSLTIVVTGKEEAVARARREIIAKLQTQASTVISIPKEHHRFILGKNVKKLQDLEKNTATRIHFPQSEENSDLVKITGSKDGIERARHELQLISDEQAKQDRAVLNIPKCFHPFISGPFGKIEEELAKETGARINIPPLIIQKDEIVVSGEKEAVAQARERILAIYEEKKSKSTTVSVEVSKSKHRYVIGPKGHTIHEILEKTGVYAEIPPAESPMETITLRGDQDKLGTAITMLYNKANSGKTAEVNAPSWIHKYIIGKQGATIKQITQDLPKVHVKFTDGQNKIEVEGPTEEVDQACALLEEKTKELLEKFSFVELNVDPKYHRFIIGKNGANVNKLKQELGVQINIPVDSETIRIVGSPENAEQAKLELMEMVARMENEVTKEVIMEQRFHRSIIGTKGEKIKEIRDRCNQVNVTFPEQGVKSDKVIVRGPKQDVDACVKLLSQMNKDLIAVNFKAEVPIYKQLHKYVIGKGGANIRKIRDETDTKIDLPAEGMDSDVIVITGKKENVLAAKEKIIAIQNSLDNIVSVDIIIPAKFYNSIIGTKGRLIRSIKEDCGGVTIQFPAEGSGSDKVNIRGPKEDVDKAKKILVELSNEKQISGFTEEVRAKKEHHKFLIGKNGANIKKIRDKTGARIIFPSDQDDTDTIQIIGHKEAVQQARKELAEMIGELDKVSELEMNVDPKFHRHFVARRGEVLRQISEDYGGVTVSFPRSGVDSDKVILKGEKKCVEAAKIRIQEIVTDLESRVTVECIIPQKHHRTIMGQRGFNVQNIQQEHGVHVKFPDREIRMENGEEPVVVNGDEDTGEPKKNDIIIITGQSDKCEAAKQALLALVPTTLEVPVAYDLHRYIIGGKGKGVREMMDTFQVNIAIPPAQDECDLIKITGPPQYAEEAKAALLEKVAKLEEERQERELRSFKLSVEVDPKFHTKIIGRRGAVVSEIRKNHDVQIQFPEREDSNENVITIIGYEKNAISARDEILKIVKDLEDLHEVEVTIDRRVHSRLIGTRGRNIRRIMDDFSVEIKFPRNTDSDPDLVIVSGSDENVDEAVDYLKNLEEEYLQDMAENTRVSSRYSNQEDNDNNQQQAKGFVVTGGPWEQKPPDTTSAEEFPSFGAVPEAPRTSAVWGPRH